MLIYLIPAALMPLWDMIWRKKKLVVFMCCTTMFLLLALRSETLGVDLNNYSAGYRYIGELSFFEMVGKIRLLLPAVLKYPFSYESGFAFAMWMISQLGLSFHGFLVIYAAYCMWSFGKWCYKFSPTPALTCFLFMCFNTFSLSFGILRQTLAMCILLGVTEPLKKKNIWKFLKITFIAFLFHRSAILILPLYFLFHIELRKKTIYKLLLLSVAFLLTSSLVYNGIVARILTLIGKTVYVGGEFQINKLIMLMFFTMLFLVLICREEYIKSDIGSICFMAGIMAIFVEIIGMYSDVIARSIYILWIYIYILLPDAIRQLELYENRQILNVGIYVLSMIYLAYDLHGSKIVPYMFFWQ